MRRNLFFVLVAFLALVIILSLVMFVVGICMPKERADAFVGVGELFAKYPDISTENFSILARFDDFTLSFNLGLKKPFFALDPSSSGSVFHISLWLVFIIIGGMVASCFVEEISAGTSLIVAILDFVLCSKIIAFLKAQVDSGVGTWEASLGVFWLMAFLYFILLFNGIIGVGSKLLRGIFVSTGVHVIVTFIVSGILANAIAAVIAGVAYLLAGLGFFGGITVCLILTILLVVFCELMDYIGEW